MSEGFDAMKQKLACPNAENCRRPEEVGSPVSYSAQVGPQGKRARAHSSLDEDVWRLLLHVGLIQVWL